VDYLVQADSACLSTLGMDEPSNAGSAEGVDVTSAQSTRARARGMSVEPNQPGSSGGTVPMSRKRKISSVTKEASTVCFDKTENAKVPAQRQNICGVRNSKTDEDVDNDTQLYGSRPLHESR